MTDNVPPEELGYAGALAELDEILRGLETDDTDVDQLADQVKRASVLLSFCRDRISGARIQIEQVVANLEASSEQQLFEEDES
ncbi:MAG: exodeoxyribonuclease VII small subunit [Acidimicrobiales bacterium]